MTDPISVTFLRDVRHGGSVDQLPQVADQLARFIAAATQSVDVAIYDFRLSDTSAADVVVGALREATERGVSVRIGYDAGKPARADFATFAMWEADPAPRGTQEWVRDHFADTLVRTRAITGGHQLMHSKYVVRDAGTAEASVWTGSTNFTDDAWTRQENNIIVIADPGISSAYHDDFDQLWDGGAIAGAGRGSEGSDTVAGGTLGWDFLSRRRGSRQLRAGHPHHRHNPTRHRRQHGAHLPRDTHRAGRRAGPRHRAERNL